MLATLLKRIYDHLETYTDLDIEWVKAPADCPGNLIADKLANNGRDLSRKDHSKSDFNKLA